MNNYDILCAYYIYENSLEGIPGKQISVFQMRSFFTGNNKFNGFFFRYLLNSKFEQVVTQSLKYLYDG